MTSIEDPLDFDSDVAEVKGKKFFFPSFTLESGKSIILKGPSGCGKTLFLSRFAGEADEIGLDREKIEIPIPPDLSKCSYAYVPQTSHFNQSLTAEKECLLSWKKLVESLSKEDLSILFPPDEFEQVTGEKKASPNWKDICQSYLPKRFEDLLNSDLVPEEKREDFKRQPIAKLSGGQKKRFALLYKLGIPPRELLILDEPDTGLDKKGAQKTLLALAENKENRIFPGTPPAILLTSHHEWEINRNPTDDALALPSDLFEEKAIEKYCPESHDPLITAGVKKERKSDDAKVPPSAIRRACVPPSAIRRACLEFKHQVSRLRKKPLDWIVLLLAPVLIFLLLCSTSDLSDEKIVAEIEPKTALYTLFCALACLWLGIQYHSTWLVENFRILREESQWTKHLAKSTGKASRSLAEGTLLGALALGLIIALIQGIIATCFYQWNLPEEIIHSETFAFTALIFWGAVFLGSLMGLALGSFVSMICLQGKFRKFGPRPPSLVWVNLLIPLIMLVFIVFTGPYLNGGSAESIITEDGKSNRASLSKYNPAHCLERILEQSLLDSDPAEYKWMSNLYPPKDKPKPLKILVVWGLISYIVALAGILFIQAAKEFRED